MSCNNSNDISNINPTPTTDDLTHHKIMQEIKHKTSLYSAFATNIATNSNLSGLNIDPHFNTALAAMNIIQQQINPYLYGYLTSFNNLKIDNMQKVLTYGAGICGHQVACFCELMLHFGIPFKIVQIYNIDKEHNSHIALEVFVRDQWAYFDITWGTYWQSYINNKYRLLPLQEIVAMDNHLEFAVSNRTCLYFQLNESYLNKNPLNYLLSPTADFIIDGAGTLHLHGDIKDNSLVFTPRGINSFFGDYYFCATGSAKAKKANLSWILVNTKQAISIEILIKQNFCTTGKLTIYRGNSSAQLQGSDITPGMIHIDLDAINNKDSDIVISASTMTIDQPGFFEVETITVTF